MMITVAYILVFVAFALIVSDFFVFSYGVLTSVSAVLFVVGTIIIFMYSAKTPTLFMHIVMPTYIAIVIFIVIFFVLGYKAQKTGRKSPVDNIINSTADVVEDIPAKGFGQIDFNGETWQAYADEPIAKGSKVVVTEAPNSSSLIDKDSLKLKVKALK